MAAHGQPLDASPSDHGAPRSRHDRWAHQLVPPAGVWAIQKAVEPQDPKDSRCQRLPAALLRLVPLRFSLLRWCGDRGRHSRGIPRNPQQIHVPHNCAFRSGSGPASSKPSFRPRHHCWPSAAAAMCSHASWKTWIRSTAFRSACWSPRWRMLDLQLAREAVVQAFWTAH